VRQSRTIAVVGPNEADDELCRIAYEVGQLVAGRGDTVVTGGLGGVMEAASRGARDAGGLVIGLLPGSDAGVANDAVRVAIPTGLGELRNALIVRSADGVIAVGGSWGTMSEIALAMRAGTPVVCIKGWNINDHSGSPVILENATSAAEAIDVLYHAVKP
jgi:uncharacterized protein (TIGR00725 family)